jgi:hypothetical protein
MEKLQLGKRTYRRTHRSDGGWLALAVIENGYKLAAARFEAKVKT